MANFDDIVERLERDNSPVEVVPRSRSRLVSDLEVYWRGVTGAERYPVGNLRVAGLDKRRFELNTERTEFTRPRHPTIRYKRLDSVIHGLLRWGVPLRTEEKAKQDLNVALHRVSLAHSDLNDEYGKAHRLINKDWRAVYAEIANGTGGARIGKLRSNLMELETELYLATEAYERKRHDLDNK